jgi:hypothetical protein
LDVPPQVRANQDQAAIQATERRASDYKDDSVRHRDHPVHRSVAETNVPLALGLNAGDASADQDADLSAYFPEQFLALDHDCRLASGVMAFADAVALQSVPRQDAQLVAATQAVLDDSVAAHPNPGVLPEQDFPDVLPLAHHRDE